MQKERFVPYQREASTVLKFLKSDISGLSDAGAEKRLRSYGANVLKETKRESPLQKILVQFKSPMVVILFIAFFISLLLKESIDAWVIISVILLNAMVGFIHEYRVEHSIRSLKKINTPFAKVWRSGIVKKILSADIVPGDIISIEEGDRIPADGRLIEAKNLKVMESALTGEALSSDKSHHTIHANLALADRKNMAYMGTFVTAGRGLFVVTETGNLTAFGRIAASITSIKPEESLFTKKIGRLSKQAGIAAIIMAAIIFFLATFIQKLPFKETFLFSMASLVSIIPEGMIALFSIILAIGAKRMVKRKALIKNLTATEGIGAITTIITDKTGTLTQNIMMVEAVKLPDGQTFGVSGSGWDPVGFFHRDSRIIDPNGFPGLLKLLRIVALCNNAIVRKVNAKEYEIIGEPTEAALVVAANKAKLTPEILREEAWKIDEPTFDSNKKYREVLVETKSGDRFVYIVGAPEKVMARCTHYDTSGTSEKLSKEKQSALEQEIDLLAEAGLRTLAVAYKKVGKKDFKVEGHTDEMIYAGIIGMKDPLRPGVKEAVLRAEEAGIRVIMATGDHKKTALAIAQEIGIAAGGALSEEDLSGLSDHEFETAILANSVFARVSPETKMRIAGVLQKRGEIVAMTGDGINDAPALKKADVGIAMGKIGTDVARDSAQIVLVDDNFATIIDAIEEGRLVFRNVQKTGSFLLSTNFAEGFTILGTIAIGLPLPLLPTQILWLNLVTDSLAGFPLAGEHAHENLLRENPKSFQENILSRRTLPSMILMVLVMVIGAVIIFKTTLPVYGIEKARTLTFLFIAFSQLFNVLNLRSLEKSVFRMNLLSNSYLIWGLGSAILVNIILIATPRLREIFHLSAVSIREFMIVLLISFSIIIFAEGYKMIKRKFLV